MAIRAAQAGEERALETRVVNGAYRLGLLVGTALALYPLHRSWPAPELLEHLPHNAVVALVQGDWRPFGLLHGALVFDVLRALFTAWYALARLAGQVDDRLDVLATYLRDPTFFILVARLLVAGAAVGSLVSAGALARSLAGPCAAAVAVILLGTMVVQVREAHHVWLDLPAGFAAASTALVALRLGDRPSLAAAALAGAAAGLTVATKHSALPIILVPGLAILLGPAGTRARRLLVSGAAAAIAFLAVSPYAILDFAGTVEQLRWQSRATYSGAHGLSLLEWMRTHIAPGSRVALPNLVSHPNPVLPPDASGIARSYPALAGALRHKGLPDPSTSYQVTYVQFFGVPALAPGAWPDIVVTAQHPVIGPSMHTRAETIEGLEAAGARRLATFTGISDPPPEGVRWDPIDFDYPPVRGAWRVAAPGPKVTIWEVPQKRSATTGATTAAASE